MYAFNIDWIWKWLSCKLTPKNLKDSIARIVKDLASKKKNPPKLHSLIWEGPPSLSAISQPPPPLLTPRKAHSCRQRYLLRNEIKKIFGSKNLSVHWQKQGKIHVNEYTSYMIQQQHFSPRVYRTLSNLPPTAPFRVAPEFLNHKR